MTLERLPTLYMFGMAAKEFCPNKILLLAFG